MRLGYGYMEGVLFRRPRDAFVERADIHCSQIGVQVPADEADECVVVCLASSSETAVLHPRGDLLNEM